AIEGYNPVHDLCRYVLNIAILAIKDQHKIDIQTFDFTLDPNSTRYKNEYPHPTIRCQLSHDALNRKIEAASDYPELKEEVKLALSCREQSSFGIEHLYETPLDFGIEGLPTTQPYYEKFGEERVKKGIYKKALRYTSHMQPLIKSLWEYYGLNKYCINA
ncbi:unnamed protein product, partial [marine sediment metagenome]